jgi:CRP-like cAMP-binding protein
MSRSHEILIDRISRLWKVLEEDVVALRNLPIEEAKLSPQTDIARVGDRPSLCVLITAGFAATSKVTLEGRRQIHYFHRAGDLPDLHSLYLTTLDAALTTVTACTVGFIRHDRLRSLCETHSRIAAALWRSTLIDASIAREWMTNLGQRQAAARLAHLLCEEYVRSHVAGLCEPGEAKICQFPVSQAQLSDAIGTSVVHVNRSLQHLRDVGAIRFDRGRLKILDWQKLAAIGEFDPTYLHLDDEVAARYPT